ncbi:hypothetical protein J5N97_003721 [Dioscorea zingiberensis]|uniref:Exoribonuclease phosphorolytic domain-containing protein n=1 Tax=Dioscorea zingiberensis TaxID=325984 RepID=A0A9D5HQC2_9LILI|nr:hypothetical protein J5N97_003721 [Dioscorea zingiberensis]
MVDTLAEKALLVVLPPEDEFPYTVCVNSEVMSFDGSTPMASVCGGSMALMDASIPLREHVAAGVASGATRAALTQHFLLENNAAHISAKEPVLEDRLPDLLAQLRPYQLHAAYWMLQQEKRASETSENEGRKLFQQLIDVNDGLLHTTCRSPCYVAPESCEQVLSGIDKGGIDAVITEDSDLIA